MSKTLSVAGILVVLGVAFLSSFVFLGCELGSADSVTRNVGVDFTGFYDSTATNTYFVTPANSGVRVTFLNLIQNGDQLEAIDNNSFVFRGSLGQVFTDSGSASASFRLEGSTTAGNPVTIQGTLTGEGTTGTMTANWVEPGIYAYINGDATINQVVTNSPTPTTNSVTVSASATSIALNGSVSLSAAGGGGTYSWSQSNSGLGTLSSSSGASITYQANSTVGTNTITVADAANISDAASVTITQGP